MQQIVVDALRQYFGLATNDTENRENSNETAPSTEKALESFLTKPPKQQ
jgi:hypothetical protein